MQDPGSFTIPCTIGNVEFKKALCDSGSKHQLDATIYSKETKFGGAYSHSFDPRTMTQLEGVLEDELIKVGKFIFHLDFIALDMDQDTKVPLLLGRPFLAIGTALIDVKKMRTRS